MDQILVSVDFSGAKRLLSPFYQAFGYANADYTYTEASARMYDYLSSYHNHVRYMRLHNILTLHGKGDAFLFQGMDYGNPFFPVEHDGVIFPNHEDGVLKVDENGNFLYDWTYVDRVYDLLIDNGILPVVETVFIPSCLRKSPQMAHLPADFNQWKRLIRDFVLHCQDRYGEEQLRQWYFEVWNEPDNRPDTVEDPEPFCALYDYMAAAVKSVNPEYRVGGPAVKQGENGLRIFEYFLRHCDSGVNHATGCYGAPLDFISVHCKGGYPADTNPSTKVMFDALGEFIQVIKRFPRYQNTPFFNDESDIVWEGNRGSKYKSWLNFRSTHYFPGFVIKMVDKYCREVQDAQSVNLQMVDSDNCHLQWEKSLFSGNRSQLTPLNCYPTTDLLKKPAFNAYVMLSRLRGTRYFPTCDNPAFGSKFGVLPTADGQSIAILAWHFEDGMTDDVEGVRLSIDVKHSPFLGRCRLIHYRIDEHHSSSYTIWRDMGKPEYPNVEQIRMLRARAGLEIMEPVRKIELTNHLTLDLEMPMHSVSLLIIVPEPAKAPDAVQLLRYVRETGQNGNTQVFLKWTPSDALDFLRYRLRRKDASGMQEIAPNVNLDTSVWVDMEIDSPGWYEYQVAVENAGGLLSEWSTPVGVKI